MRTLKERRSEACLARPQRRPKVFLRLETTQRQAVRRFDWKQTSARVIRQNSARLGFGLTLRDKGGKRTLRFV
jgi:hypothetical protein